MANNKDDYNRPLTLTDTVGQGMRHGQARHEDNMYGLYGNKAEPPTVKEPTILEKTLIGLTKMDPAMAADTAQAMTVLMGRVMDQHHASGEELTKQQKNVVGTFLFDRKLSPAATDIIMQTTVEAVTGEPYKAPTATASAPTVNPNSPKVK